VRIRIALATAVAVIVIPVILFALFSSPPASARANHVVGSRSATTSRHQAARIGMKLMSYAEARKVAKLATFYIDVTKQEQAKFLKEAAFPALAASNSANTIPAAWLPTAMCEEGGRNDPYAGYFGILEWNGFDGYPTAGSAPLSAQLAWEAKYIGAPPDAPGQCHGY
jgi:hypothetical protein